MTSQSIIKLREQYPKITNAEIARKLGISRQAVWQHVKQLGLPGDNRGALGWCLHCNAPLNRRRQTFCSHECRIAYTYSEITCDICGNIFKRRTKELLWRMQHPWSSNGKTQQYFTCSAECRSKLTRKVLENAQHSSKRHQTDAANDI